MSRSREEILRRVQRPADQVVSPPDLALDWTTYDDPVAQYQTSLELVGGTMLTAADVGAVREVISGLEVVSGARSICSVRSDWLESTVDLAAVEDAHELELVDVCVARGEFWVAENGAVWVTDEALRHRAVLFLSQHLILVVERSQGVSNMHEAYQRMGDVTGSFGVFISGPSKTADIEQSLVIGAHGARSLHVILVD